MVFLEEKCNPHEFFETSDTIRKYLGNAKEYESEYLPDIWKNITQKDRELGHGGMDYLMFRDFFRRITEGRELPIDVYDAAAWMSVSALSEQSIALGGMPVAVPDFTNGQWVKRPLLDVVDFSYLNK